jgi:hypothetical protein
MQHVTVGDPDRTDLTKNSHVACCPWVQATNAPSLLLAHLLLEEEEKNTESISCEQSHSVLASESLDRPIWC